VGRGGVGRGGSGGGGAGRGVAWLGGVGRGWVGKSWAGRGMSGRCGRGHEGVGVFGLFVCLMWSGCCCLFLFGLVVVVGVAADWASFRLFLRFVGEGVWVCLRRLFFGVPGCLLVVRCVCLFLFLSVVVVCVFGVCCCFLFVLRIFGGGSSWGFSSDSLSPVSVIVHWVAAPVSVGSFCFGLGGSSFWSAVRKSSAAFSTGDRVWGRGGVVGFGVVGG
jgi:hypothetical protein